MKKVTYFYKFICYVYRYHINNGKFQSKFKQIIFITSLHHYNIPRTFQFMEIRNQWLLSASLVLVSSLSVHIDKWKMRMYANTFLTTVNNPLSFYWNIKQNLISIIISNATNFWGSLVIFIKILFLERKVRNLHTGFLIQFYLNYL